MKAKRFKEFIAESAELTSRDGVKWWFGPESDLSRIIRTDLWSLQINNQEPGKSLEVMHKLAKRLGADLSPIIEKEGEYGAELWLSADPELSITAVWDAMDRVKRNFRRQGQELTINCVQSSKANVVRIIIDQAGDSLTTEQLVQLVDVLEEFGRGDQFDKKWANNLIQRVKELPNWPEDWTDWTLEDW